MEPTNLDLRSLEEPSDLSTVVEELLASDLTDDTDGLGITPKAEKVNLATVTADDLMRRIEHAIIA